MKEGLPVEKKNPCIVSFDDCGSGHFKKKVRSGWKKDKGRLSKTKAKHKAWECKGGSII